MRNGEGYNPSRRGRITKGHAWHAMINVDELSLLPVNPSHTEVPLKLEYRRRVRLSHQANLVARELEILPGCPITSGVAAAFKFLLVGTELSMIGRVVQVGLRVALFTDHELNSNYYKY